MRAIFIKEINSFFSGTIGYLVIAVFLILNGLFLWVFESPFNILNYGFANLSGFFKLAPWIFIFLIPAVTMRSFSEERKEGTIELLMTRPITDTQLLLGKFLGNLTVSLLAVLPTLLYVFTIFQLRQENSLIDIGRILGSYLGLIFLIGIFTAIGIFSSALTQNQIVAFIIGSLLCFLSFYAFEGLSHFNLLGSEIYAWEYLGIDFHYQSISRGVLDTRDLIYFFSLMLLFLSFTHFNLSLSRK